MVRSKSFYNHINKICRYFKNTAASGFLFCASSNSLLIDEVSRTVISRMGEDGLALKAFRIEPEKWVSFFTSIKKAAAGCKGLIFSNLDELILINGEKVLEDINFLREELIALQIPLLFWLSEENISRFANRGTDFFLRRDRGVIYFQETEGVSTLNKRDEFYNLGFNKTETYENLALKIELLESQLKEGEDSGYPSERIAREIVPALIELYLENQFNREALELFERYREYMDLDRDGKALEMASSVCLGNSRYQECLVFSEKLKSLAEELNDNYFLVKAYSNLGRLYSITGKPDKALECYKKEEKILLETGEKVALGFMYSDISRIYINNRKFGMAKENLQRAEKIFSETGNKQGLGFVYCTVGSIHDMKGEFNKALEYYLKAENVAVNIGHKQGIGAILNNIGRIYMGFKDWKNALEYFQKAFNILEELGSLDSIATSLINIGMLYYYQDQWDEALKFFCKSEKLCKCYGIKSKMGNLYNCFGIVYRQKKMPDKALEYYLEAEKIAIETKDSYGEASTLINLSHLYLQQNNPLAMEKIDLAVSHLYNLVNKKRLNEALALQKEIHSHFSK